MSLGNIKKNILALAVANLTIGLIEFVFNIYLSRILGAEGLGMLSLVTPINCIFLSFMTEGMVITMSKLSARGKVEHGSTASKEAISLATKFSFLWSCFLCLIIVSVSGPVATYALGNPTLKAPILAACPLMLLMSISNIVKGHFLGTTRIKIPALINIAEKLMRFPILFMLVTFLLNRTKMPTITLVFLCYAIGECQSVLLLRVYYKFTDGRKANDDSHINKKIFFGRFIKGSAPICLTQCLLELVNALSAILISRRLCSIGYSVADSMALFGKYRGMVFPLLEYPLILVGAVNAIIIPQITSLLYSGKKTGAMRLAKRAVLTAFIIGMITGLLLFFLADQMGAFFYHRQDLDLMIKLGGLMTPLLYVTATTTSLLISIGKESISFRNTLLQQSIMLLMIYFFSAMPQLNIYGYLLAITLSNLFLLIANSKILIRCFSPNRIVQQSHRVDPC